MTMTFQEFITSPGRGIHRPDNTITLDIFDIADILTAALRERGFLQAGEIIHAYDMEPALASVGYYLTVERKNDVITLRRSNK